MSQARFDESYGANPAENYERFFVPSMPNLFKLSRVHSLIYGLGRTEQGRCTDSAGAEEDTVYLSQMGTKVIGGARDNVLNVDPKGMEARTVEGRYPN